MSLYVDTLLKLHYNFFMENSPFICPICKNPLSVKEKSLFCNQNHCFDIAKQGYVNFCAGKNNSESGDNPLMVKARQIIMEQGYYRNLTDFLTDYLKEINPSVFLDAGAGEGFIASKVKEAFLNTTVIATDLSKSAVSLGAKKYKDIFFAVSKSSSLPLASESADVIFTAFAPIFTTEIDRILKRGGHFIYVVPGVYHLYGLKEKLYTSVQLNPKNEDNFEGFSLILDKLILDEFTAGGEMINNLIAMTPYAYKTDKADIKRLNDLGIITTKLEFNIKIYKKFS